MAKESDDNLGASSQDNDNPLEENTPKKGEHPSPEKNADPELPFDEQPEEDDSSSNFPESDFPEAKFSLPGETEAKHHDESHSDISGDQDDHDELKEQSGGSGDDQSQESASQGVDGEGAEGDGFDHDHDEYHHDYHDEYHEEHYGDDYHSHGGEYHSHEDDYGDYGSEVYDGEEEEENYGGPVKPFLDHVEDLRWMVMKVFVALLIGVLIALVGSPYIVKFLTYPLNHAQKIKQLNANPDKRMIPVKVGDAAVAHIRESDLKNWVNQEMLIKEGNQTENISALNLVPVSAFDQNGTQYSMQLHLDINATDRVPWEVELKAYGPLKSFFIALKIGLWGGISISIPFIIYFIAQFVLPALRVNEKKWLFKLSSFGTGLFFIGVAFCYFVIMKYALWASVGFANMLGFGADEWQAEEYISFVCKFLVGMGLAFQMPVILLFFVKINLIDYKNLINWRMYAVVFNLVAAALITPTGDPFTLMLVAVPLQCLYEISVLIAWYWYRKENASEELE